jgi:hypothetical protein
MTLTLDPSKYVPQEGRLKKINEPVNDSWDSAIAEAERRIADLKFSIRVFKERKARGEKWRGELVDQD